MGNPLVQNAEVLFRQIHPNSIQNGKPASDRFKPYTLDAGMMSVDRGALATAAASHALYTSAGRQSAAVYGVSVGEFAGESIQCQEDPLEKTDEAPANPAHALADYNPHAEKEQKNISKRLCRLAITRGQLYP